MKDLVKNSCVVLHLSHPFYFTKKKWLDQAERLDSHILRILNKTTSSRETYEEEEEEKLNNMNQDGHIILKPLLYYFGLYNRL